MTEQTAPLIALAAGGTGGHVFPAEALARELLGRGFRVVLFTDQRGSRFSDDIKVETISIRASALGKGIVGKAQSLFHMGIGTIQARRALKKRMPAAIVGFGGYPSLPPLFAAARLGIPLILHEQNAVLGRANRALMGRAKIVATSFPHVVGLTPRSTARVVLTGNPVRPVFAALRATPYEMPSEDGPVRLFVMGGSLGAHVFSTVVPKALGLLPAHLRSRVIIAQQARAEDIDAAKSAYAGAGVEVELAPFFHDAAERMAAAHFLICRAGGSTIAELTAIGRPSILVPFPHGLAGEQLANAEALAEAGGAFLIPEPAFTPEALAVRLEALLTLPSSLVKTAAAARAWGTIAAADNLADCVEDAIGRAHVNPHPTWMINPDDTGREQTLALSTSEKY